MDRKLSYEELQQKVKGLETEALARNRLEELYRTQVEYSLQGLIIVQEAHIVFANAAFIEMSGYTIDELLACSPDEVKALVHPDDQALVWGRLQARLEGKEVPSRYEYRGIRKDGTVRWLEMVASRIQFQGKPAIQGAVIDITDHKQAEEALKESEEKYRQFVENANEGIVLTQEGKIAYINPRALEVMGYLEEEMISRNIMEFIHPDDRERVLGLYVKKLKGEDIPPSTYRIIDKDGSARWVESRSTVLTHKGKPALLTFLIDTTERKRMEEAMRESELQKEYILDSLVEHVIHQGPDMRIQWANNAACESAGMTREELIGRYCYEIWPQLSDPCPDCPVIHAMNTGQSQEIEKSTPDGRAWYIRGYPVRDTHGTIVGGTELTLEITKRKQAEEALEKSEERYRSLFNSLPIGVFQSTPDGRFLDANPAFTRLLGCPDLETLLSIPVTTFYRDPKQREQWKKSTEKKGESFAMEVQWQKLDGTPLWVRESAQAVRDSQGRVQYYEGVAEDITEIKMAEEEQKNIESQLQHAQRMEALGTLAGGIAHDFNNLLMGIQGNASLILLKKDTGHPDYERLKNIEQYVQGGADLTKQLLGFAKGGKYDTRPTDLNEVIEKSSRMFGRTKKEITIHTKYQKAIWPAVVDRAQIEQALLNLYVNAWQAMPAGGRLYLETRNEILDKDYVKPFDIKPGRYIKISIADTGVGMDEATQQRIFEPFFTTKEMGRGTGLGLASVYGIIKNHGGHINVYSEKSEGTIFTIYLPASGTEIIKEEEVSDTIKKGTETILLVDDEDMILDVGSQMLKKLGYTVLIAKSGKEAVDIYKINKEKIDMVVLDMIMPVMGGGETYERIKKINPNVKVLLSSGYSMYGQAAEILKRGCEGFIQKPFTAREVAQRIREVLDKE